MSISCSQEVAGHSATFRLLFSEQLLSFQTHHFHMFFKLLYRSDPGPVISSKMILLLRDIEVHGSTDFAVKLPCVSKGSNQPQNHHFKTLCVSAEISFLFGGRQLATVSALTACSLFSLSLQQFQKIEEEFPHVVNELRTAAQQLKNDLEGKSRHY